VERYLASGAVIITGAAHGIGRRMALTSVAEGVDVCIADWNEEKGNSVATEPTPGKGRRIFVKTDVADEASCATVVAKTVEAFGGAFGLVNNASIFSTLTMRPFWEVPSDEWDRVQKVNLTGVFNRTRAAREPLVASGCGSIVTFRRRRSCSAARITRTTCRRRPASWDFLARWRGSSAPMEYA